jgi:hypothetical protein
MQDKYAKDGLVVVGVLLDDPQDQGTRAAGLKYLDKVKPPFENAYLDAKPEVWQKKLRLDTFPGVFIFNRDNQYVKKLPVVNEKGEEVEEVDYDVVEKTVADLLKK